MHLTLYILTLLLFFFLQQDPHKEKREKMVKQQIEGRKIKDEAVLKSMRTVNRHLFVPENMMNYAYEDRPLPIGYGQTISQPFIVAYMTEAINPQPQHKVLEIGTGSGYQAAVLAGITKEVYTVEIIPELAGQASKRLQRLGYRNVQTRTGDGYFGLKEHAPFDTSIVTPAAEFIPPPLLEQLKEGSKMIIPVGSPYMTQMLMLVEKKGKKTVTKSLFPVMFVPFTRSK